VGEFQGAVSEVHTVVVRVGFVYKVRVVAAQVEMVAKFVSSVSHECVVF